MKRTVCFAFIGLLLCIVAESFADWVPYGERYAVIVMGVWFNREQYVWYWSDTFGMYRELNALGFADENIYFLASGDSVAIYPGVVDTTNRTGDEVEWAFEQVRSRSTADDLVYVWWVDHGTESEFLLPRSSIHYWSLGRYLEEITAKVIIGAYQPCYSGAIIPYVSGEDVISIASTRADEVHCWPWAATWREALRGGTVDDRTDRNGDGHISMVEAYAWAALRAHEHGEYPPFDDNGDKVGHGLETGGYDPSDPTKDGYIGSQYALTGWWDGDLPPRPTSSALEPVSWGFVKAAFRPYSSMVR